MMIILPDLLQIYTSIDNDGIEKTKESQIFLKIQQIVENENKLPIAIPYKSFFEDEGLIDYVIHSYMQHPSYYDISTQCFVYKDIYSAIYGSIDIMQMLNKLIPDNHMIALRPGRMTRALLQIEQYTGTDCDTTDAKDIVSIFEKMKL